MAGLISAIGLTLAGGEGNVSASKASLGLLAFCRSPTTHHSVKHEQDENVVKKKAKTLDFEASLEELETLVERMEQGESSLEASLEDFERGIQLARSCQTALQDAEQKVQILLDKDAEAVDFEPKAE